MCRRCGQCAVNPGSKVSRTTTHAGSPLYPLSALAPQVSAFSVAIVSLTLLSSFPLTRHAHALEMNAQRTGRVLSLVITEEGRRNQVDWANE